METDVKVNVIKRNGEEVSFDLLKIANAIKAANNEVPQNERLTDDLSAERISDPGNRRQCSG